MLFYQQLLIESVVHFSNTLQITLVTLATCFLHFYAVVGLSIRGHGYREKIRLVKRRDSIDEGSAG